MPKGDAAASAEAEAAAAEKAAAAPSPADNPVGTGVSPEFFRPMPQD